MKQSGNARSKQMTNEQILKGKTRKELAAMIGIAYMNHWGKGKDAGKRVMRGCLHGCGAAKPLKKDEMIRCVLRDVAEGFIKIA